MLSESLHLYLIYPVYLIHLFNLCFTTDSPLPQQPHHRLHGGGDDLDDGIRIDAYYQNDGAGDGERNPFRAARVTHVRQVRVRFTEEHAFE